MRYRPFAHFRLSLSALTLALTDDAGPKTASKWRDLILGAMELGINGFEIHGRHPAIIDGLNMALENVERRLVVIGLRHGPRSVPESLMGAAFEAEVIENLTRSILARTRFGYLDMLLLDNPGQHSLPQPSLALLKELKVEGPTHYIGVAGDDDAIDYYISSKAFDVLALPFNMASGWRTRLRLRAAQDQEMAVIGYDPCPELNVLAPPPPKRRFWEPRPPAPASDPYAFLTRTPNWTTAEICLAFALTEPSLASVQVVADDLETIRPLAAASDRDLPAGLSAQIEMARIAPMGPPGAHKTA